MKIQMANAAERTSRPTARLISNIERPTSNMEHPTSVALGGGVGRVDRRAWKRRCGRALLKSRGQRRFAESRGQRRQFGDERSPGLAVSGRHFLPTFGLDQKLGPLFRRHVGEVAEGADAQAALVGRKFFKCLQSFIHSAALRVWKRAEDFFLF